VYFFLCFDEIQACYVVPKPNGENKADVEAAAEILREILVLGKDTTSVVTILTGSSKRAIRYAHHVDLEELGRQEIGEAYPNLNHSVFQKQMLKPLRSLPEMQAAFPHKQPAELAAMFYRSGGVGLHLDDPCQDPDKLPETSALLEIVTTLLVQGGFSEHISDTNSVTLVQSALQNFSSKPWEAPSLPYKAVKQIFARYGNEASPDLRQQDAERKLLLAEDGGMLYVEESGNVTLLVPRHFAVYARLLVKYGSDQNTRLAFLFQMVLGGVQGSPGSELEAPILRAAVDNAALSADYDLKWDRQRLSFADGKTTVQTLDGTFVEEWDADKLIPGQRIFQLAKDMGADGVWFKQQEGEAMKERRGKRRREGKIRPTAVTTGQGTSNPAFLLSGDAKKYEVHLVQIKTGATSKSITIGGVGSIPVKFRTQAEQNKAKTPNFNEKSVQNDKARAPTLSLHS
jgi:hypothetical protein